MFKEGCCCGLGENKVVVAVWIEDTIDLKALCIRGLRLGCLGH